MALQRGFVTALTLSVFIISGCSERSNASRTTRTDSTAVANTTASQPESQQRALVMTMLGPILDVDSSISEPRLDVSNNTYVLRLPAATAKALLDSLPGFSPLELARYPKGITSPFTYLHADVELPSVVLGDFNSDSKLDVALEGQSKQASATVMLLSSSPSNPAPQAVVVNRKDLTPADSVGFLGLLHPQEIKDPYSEVGVTLHSDAVQRVVPYQSSVVYFLEGGTLKKYVYTGD